ncbi:alpha/beta fold hydrolase [Streptomyces olivaceoviridis]
MKETTGRPRFLLVHGAWHGSWCWRELQDVLADRGWTSHTVDLPSVVPEGSGGRLPGLDEGESLMTCFGGEQPDLAAVEGVIPVREDPAETLHHDVPEDKRKAAAARLLPQSALSFAEPVSRAGWKTVPTGYVLCDDDRSLPPSYQEPFAERAGAVHHLPSGHTSLHSLPGNPADLLERIAHGAPA